jgi:DNA-binding PadR family transcriptional regulator
LLTDEGREELQRIAREALDGWEQTIGEIEDGLADEMPPEQYKVFIEKNCKRELPARMRGVARELKKLATRKAAA